METRQSTGAAGLDLARLREVTKRFVALQRGGLNNVAIGFGFFLFRTADLTDGPLAGFFLVLCGLMAVVMAVRYIPKYYEHRFGFIETPTISNRGFVILISIPIALIFIGPAVDHPLTAFVVQLNHRLHEMISDPGNRVDLIPIFCCALVLTTTLVTDLTLVWRNKPVKAVPLLAVLIVSLFWTAVFFYPLHHPEIGRFTLWRIVAKGWFGITFIGIGLYQHWQLVSLLRGRVPENDGKANE